MPRNRTSMRAVLFVALALAAPAMVQPCAMAVRQFTTPDLEAVFTHVLSLPRG